tara:strand:- start:6424 stop:7203 length:780 start_codon:yes stop_codon:yes gene_type:complete
MDLGLKNKRVVITGGSKGIGSSVADFFEKEGALLTLISRDGNLLKKKISKYKNNKLKHNFFSCNLREKNNPTNIAKEIIKKNKKIDIIIHNVGGGLGVKNYLADKNDWIDVWNFNVGIAIEMNNIFLPHMIKKKSGKIIHISSINAISGGTMMSPYGGAPAYTCAKAYLNMYIKVVGREVAKSNIIMNGVMPGPIISKGKHWDNLSKKKPKFVKDYLARYHAIERFGNFDEVSPFVLMLASKYSNYTSGSMISIDGGLL